MPMRGELQISTARPSSRKTWAEGVWERIVAIIENPEFLIVALFCAVGLWLTFYFVHFFPDYGAMVESLECMP
jgi:hypothetical protein